MKTHLFHLSVMQCLCAFDGLINVYFPVCLKSIFFHYTRRSAYLPPFFLVLLMLSSLGQLKVLYDN